MGVVWGEEEAADFSAGGGGAHRAGLGEDHACWVFCGGRGVGVVFWWVVPSARGAAGVAGDAVLVGGEGEGWGEAVLEVGCEARGEVGHGWGWGGLSRWLPSKM